MQTSEVSAFTALFSQLEEASPEWPKQILFQNHELKSIDVGTKMPYQKKGFLKTERWNIK